MSERGVPRALPFGGAGDRSQVVRALAVGVAAGALSGLFGVGGGILIVPALLVVLHMPHRLAHGTSLAAVLPISVASLFGYWTSGKVDWSAALFLSIGAVAGAVIGTKLLRVLPQPVLAWIFITMLVVTGVRMITDRSVADGRESLDLLMEVTLVLVGLVTGILAGLLGVGGGVVMIPAMVLLFGITPAVAKGTSVAVIIPTSIIGTWRNRKHQNADLPVAMLVGVAGLVSAFLLSKVSVGLDPRLANQLFALLLAVVAVRMAWDLLRPSPGHETEKPPDPLAGLGE